MGGPEGVPELAEALALNGVIVDQTELIGTQAVIVLESIRNAERGVGHQIQHLPTVQLSQ